MAKSFGRSTPFRPGVARWTSAEILRSRTGVAMYAVFAVALTALYWSALWLDGTWPDHFQFIHVLLPMFAFAGLPGLALFNAVARQALSSARPLLNLDEAGFEGLTHRLTVMPAHAAAAGAVIGLSSLALLTIFRPAGAFEALHIFDNPVAGALEWGFQFLVWTGVGIVGLEIARKLWVIHDIYRSHMTIDVLRSRPLTAFARLSAAMVVFTMAAVILATIALAQFGTSITWILGAGVPTVLAGAAFFAPLWSAHLLMEQEQERNLDELGQRIEAAISELRTRLDAGQADQAAAVRDTLQALGIARDEYRSVSTWPWQRATLGGVVSALAAPLVVWLVTRALEPFVK